MKTVRLPQYLTSLLVWIIVASCCPVALIGQTEDDAPAKNPPTRVYVGIPAEREDEQIVPLATPTLEWTLHKTEDGSHPSGNEQAMLWLMNRARTDPEAEGEFLASLDAGNILSNYSFWGVDLDKMKTEFAQLDPRRPGAFYYSKSN